MTDLPVIRATFTGTVKDDGTLVLEEPGRWRAWLLGQRGKRVFLTVDREKRLRSLPQNKWYWSMVVPLFSEYTGYEKDEAHEILKAMFLREPVALPSGQVVERTKSTTELTSKEFSEYCERVHRFLAEHGWNVPGPDEPITAEV